MIIKEIDHNRDDQYKYEIDGKPFLLKFENGKFKECNFHTNCLKYTKEDWQRFSKIADIIDDIERKLQSEEL